MNVKFYTRTGYTVEEIERGLHWLDADVICPWCGKAQPVAATGYVGGPCVKCGKRTDGSTQEGSQHVD